MKIISLFLVLFLPVLASGSPFIVSDPSVECVTCFYEVDGDMTQYPTEIDGSLNHDLINQAPGERPYQFRYGAVWEADSIEGNAPVVYSDWSPPFRVKRPSKPSAPGGQKLVP